MIDALLNTYAPSECINCSKLGAALCLTCKFALFTPQPEACYRCNKLSKYNRTCKSCRSSSHIYSVHFVSDYSELAKALILKAKLSSSRQAARTMVDMMLEELPRFDVDFVVPVPTASSRIRRRGYDHAAYMSKVLSQIIGAKHVSALSRLTQSKQVGADLITRRKQLENAYRLRPRASILEGKTVLIVDDVISSGSSLEATANMIYKSKPKRIYAAVFAKN